MLLRRIARDVWDVLAFTDESGECQVIEHLEVLKRDEPRLFSEVAAFLLRELPTHGPPAKAKGAKSVVPSTKVLRGGISEFRLGRRPDPAYRVLWFRVNSAKQMIVCTYAFTKKDEPTPKGLVDDSIEILGRYEMESKLTRD